VEMEARTPRRTTTRFFVKSEDENPTIPATPLEAWDGEGEDRHTTNVEYQQTVLDEMVLAKDSGINEADRKILSMYISLTASEFIYVLELQKAYDEARGYELRRKQFEPDGL
jgi:hypothetical protein